MIMAGAHIFLVAAVLFAGVAKLNGRYSVKKKNTDDNFGFSYFAGSKNLGHLLTPSDGCGIQPPNKMFFIQYYRTFE